MDDLKNIIEEAFERRADITPRNVETSVSDAVDSYPQTASQSADLR